MLALLETNYKAGNNDEDYNTQGKTWEEYVSYPSYMYTRSYMNGLASLLYLHPDLGKSTPKQLLLAPKPDVQTDVQNKSWIASSKHIFLRAQGVTHDIR